MYDLYDLCIATSRINYFLAAQRNGCTEAFIAKIFAYAA